MNDRTWARPLAFVAAVLGMFGFVTTCCADYDTIRPLANEIHKRLGLISGRTQFTANCVTIRPKRLTALLSSANALYSDLYNKVLVDGSLFHNGRLQTSSTFCRDKMFYEFVCYVSTVYHEMGHAEWDVAIEEHEDGEDETFYRLVSSEIVPWIDDNARGDEWLTVQEWHGYYVGGLLDKMLSDHHDILHANGIDPLTLTVTNMTEHTVKNNVERGIVTAANKGRLLPELLVKGSVARDFDRPYHERNRSYTIYVKGGGSTSMRDWNSRRGFKDTWWQAIWRHTDYHHGCPDTARELLERMNRRLTTALRGLAQVQEKYLVTTEAARQAARETVGDEPTGGQAPGFGTVRLLGLD